MPKLRFCSYCNIALHSVDPHDICKWCRQPDPHKLYCSKSCLSCDIIKKDKELQNSLFGLTKLSSMSTKRKLNGGISNDKKRPRSGSVSSNGSSMRSDNIIQTNGNHSSDDEEDTSLIGQIEKKIEKKVCDRILSQLIGGSTKILSKSIAKEKGRHSDTYDDTKVENENFEVLSQYVMSNRACEILTTQTILSTPEIAIELGKLMKCKGSYWSSKIDSLDLMDWKEDMPSLKLPPRMRHLQKVL